MSRTMDKDQEISAEEFDRRFDAGEDLSDYLDYSKDALHKKVKWLKEVVERLKAADEFIANFNTEMGLGRLEVVRDGVFEQLEENYRNAGETK